MTDELPQVIRKMLLVVLGIAAIPFLVLYAVWVAYNEVLMKAGRCPWCWSSDTETRIVTQKCESCDSEVPL